MKSIHVSMHQSVKDYPMLDLSIPFGDVNRLLDGKLRILHIINMDVYYVNSILIMQMNGLKITSFLSKFATVR